MTTPMQMRKRGLRVWEALHADGALKVHRRRAILHALGAAAPWRGRMQARRRALTQANQRTSAPASTPGAPVFGPKSA